ncbi:MAG: hypothetical protein JW776_14390 [Candidatus Lokiarchaeota archaeon]|nr:hypothetical protein [Candidatus Lokiarchaeota archaeon]
MVEKRQQVDIPTSKNAPVVIMSRFKQPWSGLLAFSVPLLVSIITWWIFFDPRYHEDQFLIFLAPTVGGLGLIGVLWAIWFDNWPYYNKLRKAWQIVLVGTIINLAIMVILAFVLRPIFTRFLAQKLGITDEIIADYVGKSIFGALSGSTFSFATLWVSATMFWPFFKYDQPKRGIFVWIVGTVITIITWVAGFLFTVDPTVTDIRYAIKDSYLDALGLTQWTIFYSLLTLMVLEYWPWTKIAKKQPFVGIYAFFGCGILGFITYIGFKYVAKYAFSPIFIALGGEPGFLITVEKSWTTMNISFADFLIAAVILVALFFDNWPKKYKQWKNFIIRVVLVLVIGIASFFLYYLVSPSLFGEPRNHFIKVPTHFLVYFLWLELLFAYVWRKWPIYKEFKKG